MSDTRITVSENGSFVVEGPISLHDHEGNDFNLEGKEKLFLCRCGGSGNKPFCDGSHKENGFTSDVDAAVYQRKLDEKQAKIEAAMKAKEQQQQ